MLVALLAVPVLLRALGAERFGLLSLIWLVIGYFSVFDFGLSLSLTRAVSLKLHRHDQGEIPDLAYTAFALVTALAVIAGGLLFLYAHSIAHLIGSSDPALASEAAGAVEVLALAIPFVLLTTAATGILQAHHSFRAIAYVRVPLGALMFLGPIAIMPWTQSLQGLTVTILLARILAFVALTFFALRLTPGLFSASFRWRHARRLFSFGGWLTVSNFVGPVLVYFDRFFVSAFLGPGQLAYYTIPSDILGRVAALISSAQVAVFPTFSSQSGESDRDGGRLLATTSLGILLGVAPVLSFVSLFASELLAAWLGEAFSSKSAFVATILSSGLLLNATARAPLAYIQGRGYPQWTARLHVFELPFYILALYAGITFYGLIGAAFVWTLRIAFDTAVLIALAARLAPTFRRAGQIQMLLSGLASGILILGALLEPLSLRVYLYCILFFAFLFLFSRAILPYLKRERYASSGAQDTPPIDGA